MFTPKRVSVLDTMQLSRNADQQWKLSSETSAREYIHDHCYQVRQTAAGWDLTAIPAQIARIMHLKSMV